LLQTCLHVLSLSQGRRKAVGDQEPFDPSAFYVHPMSRVQTRISVRSQSVSATGGSRNQMKAARESDSEGEYEDSSEETEQDSSGYEDESDYRQIRTRSTRRTRLPYSPRKSRMRKVYSIGDSDENDLRRSTRNKPVKAAIRLEGSSGFSSGEDDWEPNSARRDMRPKKARRKRAILPAYGRVHRVSDAEDESDDELDELAPLRRHRRICERCREGAAHELLRKYNNKKNKGGRPRKRDEYEESGDEAERLRMLGGWVRW
jgi:chromodomain-helicase-DNA-binding protein 4